MKRNTISPWLHLRGNYRRFPQFLVALCVIVSIASFAPAYAAETGIRGTVLWGPVKPGPSKVGQDDEAPLRASFGVFGADNKVAEFESDRAGHFEVSLPPGAYTIVPDKSTPVPFPESQKTQVTVPDDNFVVVTIRLDTGMK